ncbi:MAG: hypothetical protein PQJ61_07610 [Spirochaetales bacterium]|uniref:Uncharacterized protein n=1 Tax=Candidatus Thalassospirochaeta sargassi TaxID=3119039 RepID=A0AAJ1IG81_9SPIO|nr:hypothetical protein [Spirochaetales bacterium]
MNKPRNLCAVLLGVSFIFLNTNSYTQNTGLQDFTYLFDESQMNYYFDRADEQTDRRQWMDYVDFGLESTAAAWEKELLLLPELDYDPENLPVVTEKYFKELIADRFAQWLSRSFFNSIHPAELGRLSLGIEELNNLYLYNDPDSDSGYKTSIDYYDLYEPDNEGIYVLAEKGDKTLWAEGAREKMGILMDSWSENMITASAELRSTIDESLIDSFDRIWQEDFKEHRDKYNQQLYQLYCLEQSRFSNLRLNDQASLQFQSDSGAAEAVTGELLVRTVERLDAELEALKSGLDDRIKDADLQSSFSSENWDLAFRNLLEQGLNAWDSAEKEFLFERIEWEQTALIEAADADRIWVEAFSELRSERTAWFNSFKTILEDGRELWTEEGGELDAVISQAISEIEQNAVHESSSLQERLDNNIEMLLHSIEMMHAARSSWEYWMDCVDGGSKESFDGGSISWDANSMTSATDDLIAAVSGDQEMAADEAHYWVETFSLYQSYALDMQQKLAEIYGVVVFDSSTFETAFDGSDLKPALLDTAVLNDEEVWEAVFLDSLQVETLKARACMQYWEEQIETAEAVYAYSIDTTSLKEGADDTLQKLEQSRLLYEETFNAYADGVEELNSLGRSLDNLEEQLSAVMLEINDCRKRLNGAREQYTGLISDLYSDNPQYLADEYKENYLLLIEYTENSSAYENYLQAALNYGISVNTASLSEHLLKLLNGDPASTAGLLYNPDSFSLRSLEERMNSVSTAGFTINANQLQDGFFCLSTENSITSFTDYLENSLFLSSLDYRYSKLVEYFGLYNDPETDSGSEILWEMQRIIKSIQQTEKAEYELRLAEIRLYTSESFSQWAMQYFETDVYNEIPAEASPSFINNIPGEIDEDIRVYDSLLQLYAESDAEDFVIYDWDEFSPDSPDDLNIEQAYQKIWDHIKETEGTDVDTAIKVSEIAASLKALKAWLLEHGPLDEASNLIEAALLQPDDLSGHQYLALYLEGGHNLAADSGDLYPYIYSAEYAGAKQRQKIASLLVESEECVPVLAEHNYNIRKKNLFCELEQLGLLNSDTGELISPEEIWSLKVFNSLTDVSEWFYELDDVLLSRELPFWFSEILADYIDSLKDYAAVRAASIFPEAQTFETSEINFEIEGWIDEITNAGKLLEYFESDLDDIEKLILIVESELMDEAVKNEARFRLVETAAFDLGAAAAAMESFEGESAQWNSLFSKMELTEIWEYKDEIIAKASDIYAMAAALESSDATDWSTVPAGWIPYYEAAKWNASDFNIENAEELSDSEYRSAEIHLLKKEVLSGDYTAESLEDRLALVLDITESEIAEVTALQRVIDTVKKYKPRLHGEFDDYLVSENFEPELSSRIRAVYLRFHGSPYFQFDEAVFMPAADSTDLTAAMIIEQLAFNKTRVLNPTAACPSAALSMNDVFFRNISDYILSSVYGPDVSSCVSLAKAYAGRDLALRLSEYNASLDTVDADNWRSFINTDYIGSDDIYLYSADENDSVNFILDASETCIALTAYLAEGLTAWNPEQFNIEAISEDYTYSGNDDAYIEYAQAWDTYSTLRSNISTIKNDLGILGNRREKLLRLQAADDESVNSELKPLADLIDEFESEYDNALEKRILLIEGAGGFRETEAAYSAAYDSARVLLNEFESVEHDYSMAASIYNFASSGYLSRIADEVSPESRLAYVEDKLNRSTAAYDALYNLGNSDTLLSSAYSENIQYKEYFDRYIEYFRDNILFNRINQVMNEAVSLQVSVVSQAESSWQQALNESYCNVVYRDEEGALCVPEGLEHLTLTEKPNGSWDIGWSDNADIEKIERYFNSVFETDLVKWLESLNAINNLQNLTEIVTIWGMAGKWEEYQALSADEKDEISDSFWSNYLNRNNETDLDREGAKELLITEWKEAFNKIEGYSDEELWMYNFYKILSKGSLMQIDTSIGGLRTSENLDVVSEEESVLLANQYLIEGCKEDARILILSSIPMFTIAAGYYAMAIGFLSLPLGWIAAALAFSIAAGFTLGAESKLGESNMRLEAAKQIQNNVISSCENNIDNFMLDFYRDSESILNKKNAWERETAKLQLMLGGAEGSSEFTAEEQKTALENTIVDAFIQKGENLHDLLVQLDIVEPDAETGEDSLAISSFLEKYYFPAELTSIEYITEFESISKLRCNEAESELNDFTAALSAVQRQSVETDYSDAYQDFIQGDSDYSEFLSSVDETWGKNMFSEREHVLRLYETRNQYSETLTDYALFNSDATEGFLNQQRELLAVGDSSINNLRIQNNCNVRLAELQMLKSDFVERYQIWENQMKAIAARSDLEWQNAESRFNQRREQWAVSISNSFETQQQMWAEKYADFLNDKENWLKSVALQSTDYGNIRVLEDFGTMTEAAVSAAGNSILTGRLISGITGTEDILSNLFDGELLDEMLRGAALNNAEISSPASLVFTSAGLSRFNTSESISRIEEFQIERNNQFEGHIALLKYENLLEQVHSAEKNFSAIISDANESMENSISKTMREDGYVFNGTKYEKEIVAGATFNSYIYQTAFVSRYNFYEPDNLNFSRELEAASGELAGIDIEGLEGLADKAIDNIRNKLEMIFGVDSSADSKILSALGLNTTEIEGEYQQTEIADDMEKTGPIEQVVEFIEMIAENISGKLSEPELPETRIIELEPGAFGLHIGFAPEFSENVDPGLDWDAPGQMKYRGSGELGRIMGEFIFNKIREGVGWGEVNMPHYYKRLWDDSESFIQAPTVAELTGLGINIMTLGAGGIASFWGAMVVGLADNVAITAFDISNGNSSAGEGLFNLGKQIVIESFATLGSDYISSIDTSDFSLGKLIGLNLGQQAYNNSTYAAFNALNYDDEFGFDYSLSVLDYGLFGASAVSGYAGTAASMGVSSLISGILPPLEAAYYGSLADLGGVAAEQAAEYAVHAGYQLGRDGFSDISGSLSTAFDNMDMSINMLDIGSVLDAARLISVVGTDNYDDSYLAGLNTAAEQLGGTGLFAINISSSGLSGEITDEGIMLGKYLYELGKAAAADIAIKNYSEVENSEKLLELGFVMGDQVLEDTVWRILSGADELSFDAVEGVDAETLNIDGVREIHLNSEYETEDELLKAALVLQHEAHRDGDDYMNDSETLRAVSAHTEMALGLASAFGIDFIAGDENLTSDIAYYMASLRGGDTTIFRQYVDSVYSSGADYWKVLHDGNIMFDGSKNLYDENGRILAEYTGSGGFTASLADMLDISFDEADLMMRQAGWSWDNGTFKVDGMTVDVKNSLDHLLETDSNFKARYDIQLNLVDKVWSDFGGDMKAALAFAEEEITLARASGTMTDELLEKYNVLSSMNNFAQTWNETMYEQGLWDQQRALDYEENNIEAEFEQIYNDFQEGKIADNYMYTAIPGVINPLGGFSYITTKDIYPETEKMIEMNLANKPHGQSRGGSAVDLGTDQKYLKIFTTQIENILFGSFMNYSQGGGYTFSSYSDNFHKLSMHMLENNYASMILEQLQLSAEDTELFRTTLPAGFTYGSTGNSGELTTGIHLHYELIPFEY